MSRFNGKRAIAGVLLIKFVVWLGLSPRIARRLYARVLFRNERGKGEPRSLLEFNEVENRQIVFENRKGKKLHAWLFKNRGSNKVLMYCIGRNRGYPGSPGAHQAPAVHRSIGLRLRVPGLRAE